MSEGTTPNKRPDFTPNRERQRLEKRFTEAGYKLENGYGDDFVDEMIEIFEPWIDLKAKKKKR